MGLGVDIFVPANEVWTFFQGNRNRLEREQVVIAENNNTNYTICLTEEEGFPLFIVSRGESKEYEEDSINEQDCIETAKRCYKTYLFPVTICETDDSEDDEEEEDFLIQQEQEDAIYERDDQLTFAVSDFLQVVLQEGQDGADILSAYGAAKIDEILDMILSLLAEEYGLMIYRPMFLTDEETGDEIYVEYPYDTTEDSQNPEDEEDGPAGWPRG